jgi:hypothetical protein
MSNIVVVETNKVSLIKFAQVNNSSKWNEKKSIKKTQRFIFGYGKIHVLSTCVHESFIIEILF